MKYDLPSEHSLMLVINGEPVQKLICTDEALEALVYGFLHNAGLISCVQDVEELRFSAEHSRAEIRIKNYKAGKTVPVRFTGFGGAGVDRALSLQKIPVGRLFRADYVSSCAEEAERLAVRYRATGGMHCSALFDGSGLIMHYEDVGRHNTFDKLSGRCLLAGQSAADCLLVTTGRISEDMVKKAGRMGISVIASYTTATDQACRTAEAIGITLAGYVLKGPMRVYTCGERLC